MTVVVVGANGQLGRALGELLPEARCYSRDELDVADAQAVASLDLSGVSAIVNAAAWTHVDGAEDPTAIDAVWQANVGGVARLAGLARMHDLPLVHVSSDYVFDGTHPGLIPTDALVCPTSVYGASKAAGEIAARTAPRHYIVRTSWVFGDGPNFVRTMRRLGATRTELTVVDDQVGRPTYAPDLARAIVHLLDRQARYGVYHASGSGEVVSWAGFARKILHGTGCTVVPVTTAEYAQIAPQAAPRPANSALSLASLIQAGFYMRDWKVALEEYLTLENERDAR